MLVDAVALGFRGAVMDLHPLVTLVALIGSVHLWIPYTSFSGRTWS